MWAWSTKKNQPKIIFRSPSQPLDSIGQAKTSPNVSSGRPEAFPTRCYEFYKKNYFSEFSTDSLTHSLMRSVKRSGKSATATAYLLWRKRYEFHGEETFGI